jgi:hypothetical protein
VNQQEPDITITPEPTDEELAAIVAAVQVIQAQQAAAAQTELRRSRSRWADIARRESLRSADLD